jgi:hypothetical protein
MVDYNAAFKKPFLDIKNLAVGILLSILPIISWFATGYMLECTGLTKKKVALGKSPEWTDWGDLFVKGFLSFVIGLVYMLPGIIIFALGVLPAVWIIIKESFLSTMTGSSEQFVMQNWDKLAPAIITAIPFIILAVLLFLLASYLAPMAVMNYLSNDRFGAGFAFGKVFKKAFTGAYFVAWLLAGLIMLGVGFVASVIPLIGGPIGSFVGGVISYTILGQAYKEIKG